MPHSDSTQKDLDSETGVPAPDEVEPGEAGPAIVDQIILATAGYDHTIKFWAAHTGVCTRTHQHPDSQVNCLDITPDATMVVAGGYQHIRMYDPNSSNLNAVVNYEGVSKNIMAVGFQEDGKWMYSGGEDCSARIWDLKMRNLSCQRVFQTNAPVNTVCLHPNQQELVVGDHSGVIHRWNLKNDESEQLIPEPGCSIQHIDIDPLGQYMAAVNSKGKCYIWSLTSGEEESTELHPKRQIPLHKSYGLSCKFSPDSSLLATTSADHTCKILRTADFHLPDITPVQELTCQNQRWVWDCAFSSDSNYLVTGSSDGTARLWDIASGTVKKDYQGHQKAITCLAFRDVSKLN